MRLDRTPFTGMIIFVRTTVTIDDALFRAAKRAAAQAGCSLSDLVNQALHAALSQRKEPRPEFHMITYGGRTQSAHEPEDFKNAVEAEDAASLAR